MANEFVARKGIISIGDVTANSFLFPIPVGDPSPIITARTVPTDQGGSSEKTELILFHSNDNASGSGIDQITLRAPGLSFQTYNLPAVSTISATGGYNERMYITPTGDVGIGTTGPGHKLDVNGTARIVTVPTITTATKALVKDPSTGQISEQTVGNFFAPPSAVGSSSGEIIYIGTGTTVAGSVYYLNSSSQWTLAVANSTTNSIYWCAIALGTSPTANGMLIRGYARYNSSSYTSMTTGSIQYMSTSTAGGFLSTAPTTSGNVVRILGYCVTGGNTLYFNPDNTWVELV